jgi:hypothetical protein
LTKKEFSQYSVFHLLIQGLHDMAGMNDAEWSKFQFDCYDRGQHLTIGMVEKFYKDNGFFVDNLEFPRQLLGNFCEAGYEKDDDTPLDPVNFDQHRFMLSVKNAPQISRTPMIIRNKSVGVVKFINDCWNARGKFGEYFV